MTKLEPVDIAHAGRRLLGEVARPKGAGPFPAVLVMASAYGLGEQVRRSARALAARGWIGLCTDMYGDGAYFADPSGAGPDFSALMANPQLLRQRVVAWFEAAQVLPGVDPGRVAAIGYCFGGRCVLELARSGADVRAAVSYHGILNTHAPAAPGAIRGEVAAYCGALDPFAPLADIAALAAELTAAGARHQITTFSHVAHSFTDPDAARHSRPGIAYDAQAHRVSWAGTLALLEGVFAR